MKRRNALIALGVSGVAFALPGCETPPATSGALSEDQLKAMLALNGVTLAPGEAPAVLESFTANRFATILDPTIQPQCDFDPEVD